mgnify:CR=1 FL=1
MKFDEIVIINWWVSKQRGLIEVNFQREVAQELLGDFDPLTSEGMKFVLGLFNNQNTVNRLVSFGSVISELLNIEFPRNYKRNKNLLIKWFDMNIDQIQTLYSKITFTFKDTYKTTQIRKGV